MTETELDVREAPKAEALEPVEGTSRSGRVVVIRPAPRWPHLDVGELWHYRELLTTFVWRDLKVRYKQTFIGVAWAILQPFMTMVVFTLVFGKFASFPADGLPYPVFTYSGLLLWTYFSSSMSLSSTSLVQNVNLVTKVYFPRVLLPFATVLTPAVDFLLAFGVLLGLIAYYHVPLSGNFWLAPAFVLLAVLTALGGGLLLSAINVRYRDVPYVIPYVLQMGLFLSPVAYSVRALPDRWQWVFALNPMSAVTSGFRWSLVDTPAPPTGQLLLSVTAALVFFVGGLTFFRRSEPRFADTI